MTDLPYRQEYVRDVLGHLRDYATGARPIMSHAEISRQLAGSQGRLAADTAAGRQRIIERGIGRQGMMTGMTEESLAELDRAALGQKRQLEAGVQNQLAAMAPDLALRAGSLGLGFLGSEQDRFLDEWRRAQAAEMARAQFSRLHDTFAGALAGMNTASGFAGSMGDGAKGGQGWFNMPQLPWSGDWHWQAPGTPSTTHQDYGYYGPSYGSARTPGGTAGTQQVPTWNVDDVGPANTGSTFRVPRRSSQVRLAA
jgi:hypothetical protein